MNNLFSARTSDIVVQNFDNEVMIYDLTINKAYILNETSSFIWKQLDGKTSIREINTKLEKHASKSLDENIVWLALSQLKKNNLLEQTSYFSSSFENTNRREIIKKIGLMSMITLPMISSLVAPIPTMAASATSTICQPCETDADCNVGTCKPVYGNPSSKICAINTDSTAAIIGFDTGASLNCTNSGQMFCCSGKAGMTFPPSTVCHCEL